VWGEDHVFGRKLMLESCRRSSDVNFHFWLWAASSTHVRGNFWVIGRIRLCAGIPFPRRAFVTAAKKLLRSMVAIASVCASNRLMHLQDPQFSNNPSSTFGPPGFDSAAFAYKGGALNLPVQLSY
jgi:hypothetical protein